MSTNSSDATKPNIIAPACNLATAKPKRLRGLGAAIVAAALLCTGLAPRARCDTWDKKTIFTFNNPIEVPGKALPAGTYVFKLMDSPSNRRIVQIFDKHEKKLLATIPAIPDYRLTPSDRPVLQFEERPSASPQALKAFFYPGDNFGLQFVYPHDRAVELAKRTNQNVLSMSNDMAGNMRAPNKSATEASVQALQNAEVTGVSPSGEPVDLVIIIQERPE